MLFTTPEFFVLFACTFVVYYWLRHRSQQITLLILSSLIFYAWSSPALVTLLIASATMNATIARLLCVTNHCTKRRLFACTGVALNLGVLAFFKYSPLVGGTFFSAESSIGAYLLAVPLPIGVSFFTFQGISLVVDTFRDENQEKHSGTLRVFDTGLFIVFFPQLVAGPIVKSKDFLPQIGRKCFSEIQWSLASRRLITGFFLKMVVADNLKDLTSGMQHPFFIARSSVDLLWMLFGYSMQIFADFAGYSLIAIGLACVFGYHLQDNFLFPYCSASFSEFWRRWHISLSSFLKEYLYIPLGGNRHGSLRTSCNLFVVMLLGGLWHGAAWSYVVWGAYHGVALVAERWVSAGNTPAWWKTIFGQILRVSFVFGVVSFGWLLFVLPDFDHVVLYIQCIVTNQAPFAFQSLFPFTMIAYSMPVVLYHAMHLVRRTRHSGLLSGADPWCLGVMLFLILVNSGSSGDFVYFQF